MFCGTSYTEPGLTCCQWTCTVLSMAKVDQGCLLCAQYYAGGPRASTCLEVVQQNRCHDPTLQQVSSSEIAEGACPPKHVLLDDMRC